MPRLSFFLLEPFFDHRLRGDSGVIGAGHPERVEALHPFHADQDVLQRVVQRMPQVQGPGHIGRRNHDRVRLCDSDRARRGNNPPCSQFGVDPLLGRSMVKAIGNVIRQKMRLTWYYLISASK